MRNASAAWQNILKRAPGTNQLNQPLGGLEEAGPSCGRPLRHGQDGTRRLKHQPSSHRVLAPLAFPLEANSHSFLQLPQVEEAHAIKGPAKLTLLNARRFAALLETIAQLRCPSDLAHSLAPRLFEL